MTTKMIKFEETITYQNDNKHDNCWGKDDQNDNKNDNVNDKIIIFCCFSVFGSTSIS